MQTERRRKAIIVFIILVLKRPCTSESAWPKRLGNVSEGNLSASEHSVLAVRNNFDNSWGWLRVEQLWRIKKRQLGTKWAINMKGKRKKCNRQETSSLSGKGKRKFLYIPLILQRKYRFCCNTLCLVTGFPTTWNIYGKLESNKSYVHFIYIRFIRKADNSFINN